MFAWVQTITFPMIHKMEEYIHSKSVSLERKQKARKRLKKTILFVYYSDSLNFVLYICIVYFKIKLQKAGGEIFNSRQNTIQYEKHYKGIFKIKIKEHSTINQESMHPTLASKYIKQVQELQKKAKKSQLHTSRKW